MEDLLAKFFSGEASKSEKEEVLQWRSVSKENAQEFLEYKQAWESSKIDEGSNQAILDSVIGDQDFKVIPIWQTKPFRFAASLLIGLGILFSVYIISEDDEIPQYADVTIKVLPDGSEVVLHRGATIEILGFEDMRKVRLTGKAYFDIERDETKPFVIETESAFVQVLGTTFLIDDNPIESEVMVESGVVRFMSKLDKSSQIELSKGERGSLSKHGDQVIMKSSLQNQNHLSWKTHHLEFRRAQLSQVSKLLEDVYDVDIEFENVGVLGCQLTATFQDKNIAEIAKIISESFDLKSKINGHSVTFIGKGCN